MNEDYLHLRTLKEAKGYKLLEAIWMHQISKIEESRDKAAQKGSETAWRYWAGLEKGTKLMATALDRALLDMEKEDQDLQGEDRITQMLDEIKVKGETTR